MLDSKFGRLFAWGVFGELPAKWSMEANISGDGAWTVLENFSAQDLVGRRLTEKKRTFTSGRLLGME